MKTIIVKETINEDSDHFNSEYSLVQDLIHELLAVTSKYEGKLSDEAIAYAAEYIQRHYDNKSTAS
jgi:hypothetical protein